LQQEREKLLDKAHQYQQKVKENFDKKEKIKKLLPGDLVLKWISIENTIMGSLISCG
jgi:hypothetical protein